MSRLLLVVASLAVSAGCKTDNAGSEESRDAAAAGVTTVEVTTASLYREYAADHAAAFAEHRGHALVVTGKVWGTAAEPFRVGLEVADEPFGSVLAQIDEASARAAGITEEGATAKLKCRWLEQDTEAVDISLADCTVAE